MLVDWGIYILLLTVIPDHSVEISVVRLIQITEYTTGEFWTLRIPDLKDRVYIVFYREHTISEILTKLKDGKNLTRWEIWKKNHLTGASSLF